MIEKDEARFRAKITPPDERGCMLWTGRPTKVGYGQFSIKGRYFSAHRLAYELAYGPIPDGLVIDHVKARGCDSTLCVAPDHLEAVTPGENVRRGDAGKRNNPRTNARKTHCPQGHPYDDVNTYVFRGSRYCLACKHARRGA